MKNDTTFTSDDVGKIAKLAAIPVTESEKEDLAKGFTTVMQAVDHLNTIDTTNVIPTHHVTGLKNITRDDKVDEARTFTQEEALKNAKETHDGYFVVDQILEND